MKRGILLSVFLSIGLLLIPSVLGEIYIKDVGSLYNVGDTVRAEIVLSSLIKQVGFLEAKLVCGTDEIDIYKSIQVIEGEQSKSVYIEAPLDRDVIGELKGQCFILAKFGVGKATSQIFEVSRGVRISVFIEGIAFVPGDVVNVTGSVSKLNGEVLNGFVEISFKGTHFAVYEIPIVTEIDGDVFSDEGTNDVEEEEVDANTDNESQDDIQNSEENINDTIEDEIENNDDEVSTENLVIEPVLIEEYSVEEEVVLGSVVVDVMNGEFFSHFQIPENANPGKYNVNVRAYDQDRNGNILNEGEASSNSIIVKQVIRGVSIDFPENVIVPGNEFFYTAYLYDQAKIKALGEGDLKIFRPDGSILINQLFKSREENTIFIEKNYTPGYWNIVVSKNEFKDSKLFLVEELELLSFELVNETLKISNLGNVRYIKEVEISIGGISEVKIIDLKVGQSKRFRLNAPDGEYVIEINDGEKRELGTTFLTGRAIGIDAIEGFFSESIWFVILLLIIVVMIIIMFIVIKKILKKKLKVKLPKIVGGGKNINLREKNNLGIKGDIINKGVKESAFIVSLKIKNLEKLRNIIGANGNPLNGIDQALLKVKKSGAKIYVDGEYRIVIFSTSVTKQGDNDLKAINAAWEIAETINKYNSHVKKKIEFGISAHIGDLGIESSNGKIKFVSLGNTIPIVKRISDFSNGEVLLSEDLHKKTLGKVKVNQLKGKQYWKLLRIMDREKYEDFISRFLKRQRERG